tara:strand:- start:372 stop:2573 length:2202 start_codon:yes stop_codon:yes gene_type:complete
MTRKIILFISLFISLFLVSAIFYLSTFGVKTKILNSEIKKKFSAINSEIEFNINEINYLLNPFNFTFNVETKNSQILIEGNKLDVKSIKTNVSLKSLINKNFSIDDLQISTSQIKLDNLILLARTVHNTPQLFILNTITKDGTITADININFDNQGKIKDNFKIKGFVKNTRLDLFNKSSVKDLNFSFNVTKEKYLLDGINATFNEIKLSSPSIQIEEKDNLYVIDGIILSKDQNLEGKDLELIFGDLFDNADIRKVKLSSTNNFSFTLDKKLKFKDLIIETVINLDQLTFTEKSLNLELFLLNAKEEIKLENHKIKINYSKDQLTIDGRGDIFLTDKIEKLSYNIIKDNNQFLFNTKLNIENNPLIIEFLDYEKKKGVDSFISISGDLKKNGSIEFKSISLEENKNKILINNLELSPTLKIKDLVSVSIDYKNNKDTVNKLNLKKNNSNFILKGDSFNAVRIINNIVNNDTESSSIFQNLNSKIDIEIKKTYIDEINYLNNLSGYIYFKNNKIKDLKLDSVFPNNKRINLMISTSDTLEKTTNLFTDHPKPLIKRYNFIKGFEEGYLKFNSIKKDNISNSILVINNFKIKEVPVFAKILSLASLQGIADILTGEGIRFNDFEMKFSNQKGLTTIKEMYAIGPAVSILMDGYIERKKIISLRGTLVPATTINKSIASIPFLGDLLIGDKIGEGVFGVSFKIKGAPNDLSTTVNPIKTLTPRFITRTLEKIKKN